ncbi:hypothetical protein DP73_01850 [Desulfosporosinus sp. HMP52]|uniref:peptidoglycan-binding protein n=1 Tax=Desulfosporosinus sp. HMP52 TaxID=1487923 RepID=UPI00051F8C78|nr:peptidoglycan-binding protein [Desulfosporosinus sp. HMP52]KGK91796.1 hypothetical protein DP73_01850 [Desulfosporosinus sp. HMP52]
MRTLRIGSRGDEVVELQSTLSILKYKPGTTDGIFGVKTESAVIQFQKDYGLVPDGIVGSITWGYLQRLIATYFIYIIKPGDTFYKIALAHNSSLSELLTFNPGINPTNLRIGQAIQLTPVNITEPSIRIIYPKDGAYLPYSDIEITWIAAPDATSYTVVISDLDNPLPYLRDYTADVPGDTHSFTLTTDHIISGHHYVITVYIMKSIDPLIGSYTPISMPKVNVTIGENTVKSLTIKSPVQNATILQGKPVFLQWDDPADASTLNPEVLIQSTTKGTYSYSAQNGSEIPKYMLSSGKYQITVYLRSGEKVLYQASINITIVS